MRRGGSAFTGIACSSMVSVAVTGSRFCAAWTEAFRTHSHWQAAFDVGRLPNRPGKALQLELKATTVAGAALHDVLVDLGQLWEYHRLRSLGHQPFYAFPWPHWRGDLAEAAHAGGREVTELGFGRSGGRWWFANWMVLLTTAQVAAVLNTELMAHGKPKRGEKKGRLVRFDLSLPLSPVVTWGSKTEVRPSIVRWRTFWPTLEQCGEPEWPQLIRLPEWIFENPGPFLPSQVTEMLRESARLLAARQWDNAGRLVTLEPDGSRNYQIAPDPVADPGMPQDDAVGEADDNRQIVFLEARALFHASRGGDH